MEKRSGRSGGCEGLNVLNSENGNDVERRPKPRKKRGEAPEIGKALKTVYQRTVEEDIPPEMLDLLGKLG